jgi:hypothetical protein
MENSLREFDNTTNTFWRSPLLSKMQNHQLKVGDQKIEYPAGKALEPEPGGHYRRCGIG